MQTEYQLILAEWKAGSVAGVFNSVGTIFLLYAMRLPATMAFPISAIIAIIGGVALTSLVYKERLDRFKISGILFGLATLCLTVFRE
jgi:drug/metabolite transporter (DMT)-like permease